MRRRISWGISWGMGGRIRLGEADVLHIAPVREVLDVLDAALAGRLVALPTAARIVVGVVRAGVVAVAVEPLVVLVEAALVDGFLYAVILA